MTVIPFQREPNPKGPHLGHIPFTNLRALLKARIAIDFPEEVKLSGQNWSQFPC
jgi:hypothetical protein